MSTATKKPETIRSLFLRRQINSGSVPPPTTSTYKTAFGIAPHVWTMGKEAGRFCCCLYARNWKKIKVSSTTEGESGFSFFLPRILVPPDGPIAQRNRICLFASLQPTPFRLTTACFRIESFDIETVLIKPLFTLWRRLAQRRYKKSYSFLVWPADGKVSPPRLSVSQYKSKCTVQ